jgi:cytochrome c biogenesis protein CcmG/thiol:disulfide interchange protein DsbE
MWRYLIPVGVFGALVAFFFVGLDRDKETLPSPLVGKPSPVFSLGTIDDPQRTFSNADLKGRPYVLNVWATWCTGCRQEHGALLEIARRGEVPMIGLYWKDERDLGLQWLSQLGNPYAEVAIDPEGRAAMEWGVYGAPETFLVDGNGIVLHRHVAPLTIEIWERDFVPLIKRAQAGG